MKRIYLTQPTFTQMLSFFYPIPSAKAYSKPDFTKKILGFMTNFSPIPFKKNLLIALSLLLFTLSSSAQNCGPFVKVATGGFHSIAIKSDGTLWGWGANHNGQLGIQINNVSPTPIQLSSDTQWKEISAGSDYSMAIKTDGTLWGWGNNQFGQIGDGTTIDKLIITQIGKDSSWKFVSCGSHHTIAIDKKGKIWAWGSNQSGQLGIASLINKNCPNKIGNDSDWLFISSGIEHTLALKSNGTLWSWGHNANGQLGIGNYNDKNVPTQIGTDTNWLSIISAGHHNLALKSNNTLWGWGYNAYGQLGDVTTTDRNVPIQIDPDQDWKFVVAGQYHSLAIKTNGSIWAWGKASNGQLGDGQFANRLTKIQIGTQNDWQFGSVGTNYSIFIKSNGTLWATGGNNFSQLGDNSTVEKNIPTQICSNTFPAPTLSSFNPSSGSAGTQVTLTGTNLSNVTSLSIGGVAATLISKTATQIVATVGQGATTGAVSVTSPLGNATAVGNFTVALPSCGPFVKVSTGANHTVAIKSDGTLWSWGNNDYGQLGIGTFIQSNSPIQIGIDHNWSSIAAGERHTIAIKSDGTLWAWGYNFQGLLGDGSTSNRNAPVQIGTANNWRSVSAGSYFTIAIKSDGTLWAWGDNNYGQLGDGSNTFRNSPQLIDNANNWSSVDAGYMHTLAIKTDGTLWAWGWNGAYNLGDGTVTNRFYPVQIGTASNWTSVSAGQGQSYAIKSDGTLWAWGLNNVGQLGNGNSNSQNIPIQIGTATNWSTVVAGENHALAIKNNGTLWTWGFNSSGQLGNGTLINNDVPVQAGTSTNWFTISCGGYHSAALKADATLWSWGPNWSGQLGDGTTTNKNIPTQICSNTLQINPEISGFNPSSGPVGSLVSLVGNNLGNLLAASLSGNSSLLLSHDNQTAKVLVMPGSVSGKFALANPNSSGISSSNFDILPTSPPTLQIGQKNSPTDAQTSSFFASTLAVSADGNTALLGEPSDDNNNGAVWYFSKSGNNWVQEGSKLTNPGVFGMASFGSSLALSADGKIALIGAPMDQNGQGAAYIYERTTNSWNFVAKLVGSGSSGNSLALQGGSVALSADGKTAVLGSISDENGIGAIWVFTQQNGTWQQVGTKLSPGNTTPGQVINFSNSLAISANGKTIAVGGPEDSFGQGAIWVFQESSGAWIQQGNKLVGSFQSSRPELGKSVTLSADGNTLLAGVPSESNGNGAAIAFVRNAGAWSILGTKITPSDAQGTPSFGKSIVLSADGSSAIISGTTDNNSGAIWAFSRTGGGFTQLNSKIVSPSAQMASNNFGNTLAASPDFKTLLVTEINDQFGFWNYTTPFCPLPSKPDSIITRSDYVITDSVATFTVVPVSGATSYQWTLPSGWTFRYGQGTDSILVNTTQTGGMLQVAAVNACGIGPVDELNVIPYAPVTKPVLAGGSGTGVSAGSSTTISINPVPNVTRYIWLIPPGFVLVSGGGENDTFAVVMPIGGGGTVTVTAQGPGGVSNSLTIPITVSQRWNPNNPLSKGPVMEWASARTPLITHYEKNIAVLENGDFALAGRTYLPSTQINFSAKDSFIETNAHSILAIYDSIGSIKNFILSPLAYSRILKAEDNGLIAIAKAVDANPIDFDPGPGTYYLDNQLLSNPATYIVKYNQQLQLQWAKALDADLSWLNLNAITRENGNFILATGKSANGFKWIGENGVEASFPANTNAGTILQFNTSGTLIQAFSGPNGIPSGMAINEELNDLYLLTGDLDTYKLTLSRYNLISDSSVSKELPGKYFIGQAAIQFNFHKLVIGQTIDALNEDLNYGTEQNPVIVPFSNTNQGTQIVLLCFNENLEINWAKGLLRNNSNSGNTNPLQDLVINTDSSIWISGFVQRGLSEPGNTLDFDPGPESFTPQLMPLTNNPFAFNFIGTYTWNGDLISAFYPNQHGGEYAFLAANTKGRLLHLSRGGIANDENAQRIAVDQFNPRDPSFRIPVNNQFYQVQPNLYFNNPTAHLAMYKLGTAPGPRLVSPQNPEVCAGQTINLEATGTAPFSWFTQASGGTAIHSGSSFSPPNLTQDTVFYLQDASYPSTARTAVSIRVNSNPVPVLTTPNAGSQGEFGNPAYNGNGGQLLCSGAVLFQALPAPGTDSIHQLVFNFGDGSPLDTVINQASVLHEFPVNNSINWFDPGFPNSRYTIQVTAISNKGCKTQTSLQRDIKNSPVAAITLESASSQALAGNRFQFRSASSNQHPSYIQSHTWLFGDSSTSSQTNPPGKTFLKTGDYSVKLVVSAQTGCTDTASVTIQVLADSLANSGDSLNPGSNACGLVAAFNVVNNDSVQELAANRFSFFNTSYHTGFGWANAYSWNFGDGTSSNNTFVYDKSYTQPGVYKVTLTASSSLGCIQSVSRYVRVTPSATTDFTFVSESCGSKTVSFAGQSSMPVNTWNWDFGDGNGSTQQNPTHTYANPGSYLVRLQINGSNQVVSKTVVIGEKPQQLAINPQALTCGNGYLFTGLASGSNLSYSWQFELQGAQGTLTGNQVYREYSQNGLENIRLTVSSGACSSTLELNNYPVLAAVAQAPLVFEARMIENGACETGIRFTAPLENNAIYLWDFGDGSKSETSSPVIFHAYQSTGTFYPTLTVKSESCSRFASQAVQVSAIGSGIPEAAFKLIYRPNTQCIVGNRYDFFNTTQLNSWGWVPGYQCDFGDGTSSTQTFIYGKSYTRPGTYTVSLRAISNVGCTTTVSTQVTVLDNPCDGITWGQKNTNLTSKDQITQESGFTTGLSQKSPIEYPIALYPNPSTGKTTLDLSKLPAMEVELVVYDALGRVWKLDNAKRKTGTETELNLEHLPNGQYHLHILSGTQQNRVLPLIIIR